MYALKCLKTRQNQGKRNENTTTVPVPLEGRPTAKHLLAGPAFQEPLQSGLD
jgi:hypothetical protein